MRAVVVIVFFMFAMVTIPYLFLENMPFDSVVAYIDDCGKIVIEHGSNHNSVSAIIFYSLFISVAIGLPYLRPDIPKMWKLFIYALGFWVASALAFVIYYLTFPDIPPPQGLKMYSRFAIAFILLISFTTIKNSWIKKIS